VQKYSPKNVLTDVVGSGKIRLARWDKSFADGQQGPLKQANTNTQLFPQ